MSLSDLASIGSLVSGAAVLGSLIYLALQVRQTDRNQQASIRQGRTTRAIDLLLAQLDPGIANAWPRGLEAPDEITQTELRQFLLLCRAQFHHVEDAFYQHGGRAVERRRLCDGARRHARLGPLSRPRAAWKGIRRTHTGRFADFMDDIVAGGRHAPTYHVPSVDEWRADVAAEATSAPQ